ncbi:hypothetical protein [Methanosphaerula palustris]|uniref:Uncharacterized protein n=1 Tax=Methanosphaerula palustris (strain ATCC BAA-1556 / DSM 19958 / E1-9c) TaxID=521011 RepID=B8GE81_METPE|nr:hypothetical protein [Methanosphaerula palustris]ACL17582.1 hypothetical protein Mpal_2296 [Methanosphaerula palustris E1-9c]
MQDLVGDSTLDGVSLQGFSGQGYLVIENYASRFICEEVEICHSLDGRSCLPFGKHSGCPVAFMTGGGTGSD